MLPHSIRARPTSTRLFFAMTVRFVASAPGV
jgi:hypothetical protein